MQKRSAPDETKARIIRTAGEVFGAYGFNGTTVRQITEKAGVNVAAVNYHFQDKFELYVRVLREAKEWTQDVAVMEFSGSPEEQLRDFIFAFVRHLLDPNRPVWHVQVITHEMQQPTPALDVLIRELTEPLFNQVRSLAGAVCAVPLSDMNLDLLASSIVGQCLFYVRSRPMIERLCPELNSGPERIDRIAHHISTFSLAALHGVFNESSQPALPQP